MKLHHVYSPKTVAELKKLINELPDDMEVSALRRGERMLLDVSLQQRGAGKGKENRTVSRGGVTFLAWLDF